MKVETVLIDLEPAEAPKKRVRSPSKPKKPARILTKSEEYLIDYWIEMGMVRRDGRFPGDTSQDVYLFQHELVEDVELPVPWSEFFQMFNNVNHDCFLKELEGEIVENPFDPWRSPKMVGISFRIRPHNRQDYQLVKVITRGDAMNKEVSDVEPVNLHKDVLIVPFTLGDQVNNSDTKGDI
ncbi:MAG: hypothetical protein OXI63_02060 [Candidatus Poribacteria bacterium]|nr:hypothetical protein [Candidatus Poribacteria bacterium]